jgi:uncharacterized protein YndB with AHSA1/START domain
MAEIAITFTRTFEAPAEAVFDAWIDPKQIVEWYGPEGFTNTVHTFDVREGGEYRLTMHSPSGEDHPLRGTFKTIDRPRKLVFSWQWEQGGESPMGQETLVTVEFTEVGGKTEMVMTHSGFVNEEVKKMHEHGWSGSIDKLARRFA